MRILELINNLEIGGAERMLVDLSLGLRARGHEVVVACLRGAGPLSPLLETAGVPVISLEKQSSGFSLASVRLLAKYLRSTGVDIVHTHNPIVHHYGLLAGRMAGVPLTVNTLHGPGNLQGWRRSDLIFEVSCLFSDAVVACCDAVHKHLRNVTSIARRHSMVIPNGVHLERFAGLRPPQGTGETVFGIVGRLVAVKDHGTLLRAFERASRVVPDIRLEILGDGPLRSGLERLSEELRIAGQLQFHGPSLDVRAFLERIDVAVLCSLSEGLPLTMLESMAAARPIIGTEVGAIPDLVRSGDCGWLCPPSDVDSLAERIVTAVNSRDQHSRLGTNGRKHVLEKYTVEKMVESYESLFNRLLGPSQDPGARKPAFACEAVDARTGHSTDR